MTKPTPSPAGPPRRPATSKIATRKAAYHHGDLRRALIAAARAILEQDGLPALSLRAVARRAGVSQAAPYHHFPDKDALLAALGAEGFDALDRSMRERMAGVSDPARRLVASGVGYVAFAVENPALFQIMFGASMRGEGVHPERSAAGGRAYATLEKAVQATLGDKVDEAGGTALACLRAWSLAHGLAKLLVEGGIDLARYGARDVEELARRTLSEPFGPGL
jgi:AcrR family transcriptional regulator